MISISNSEIARAKRSLYQPKSPVRMNTSLNLLSYFFKKGEEMSPSKKRPNTSALQDETVLSPRKKRAVKTEAEGPDTSVSQESLASSVLYEIEENNLINSPSKKKKKKKKDQDLEDESILGDISELNEEETLTQNVEVEDAEVENDEENSTKAKKKKKKKKKKRRENQSGDEQEAEEEIDSEMTFDDTKRMFEDIQKQLTADKTLKTFWETYRFRPYTSENCKTTFEKILTKVQKKRTPLELVDAAGKMMEQTPTIFCEKRLKQLKPVTAFKLFYQSHYKKMSDKHPEYKGITILNKMSKKWRKSSDEKKLKYMDLALSNRPAYMEDVKDYQNIVSSFKPKPVLSRVEWLLKDKCGGVPDVPARHGFNSFLQKTSNLYAGMSQLERLRKLSADFKLLPTEVKEKYNSQVKEEKKEYDRLLKIYVETLSESDLEDRTLANYKQKSGNNDSMSENLSRKKSQVPKKPPMSGYMLFYLSIKEELQDIPILQRHVQVSAKWKALPEGERIDFNKRRLLMHQEWLKELRTKEPEETTESSGNNV